MISHGHLYSYGQNCSKIFKVDLPTSGLSLGLNLAFSPDTNFLYNVPEKYFCYIISISSGLEDTVVWSNAHC